MGKLAKVIADFFLQCMPDMDDIQYKKILYTLEVVFDEASKFIIYGILFAVLGLFMNFAVAAVSLGIMRTTAGGYHANTYWGCFLITLICFLIAIYGGIYIKPDITIKSVIMLLSFTVAAVISPVDHPNNPINNPVKRKKMRIRTIIFFIGFASLTIAFDNIWANTVFFVLIVEAMTLPAGLLFNKPAKSLEERKLD